MASQRYDEDGGETGSGANYEARLFRFSYNAANDTYTPDAGFPVVDARRDRSETLVIAKDSTGMLWATWTLRSAGNRQPSSTRCTPTTLTTPPGPIRRRCPFAGATTAPPTTSPRSSRSPPPARTQDRRVLEQPG